MKNYKNAFSVLNFVMYVKIKHIVLNVLTKVLFQSIYFLVPAMKELLLQKINNAFNA